MGVLRLAYKIIGITIIMVGVGCNGYGKPDKSGKPNKPINIDAAYSACGSITGADGQDKRNAERYCAKYVPRIWEPNPIVGASSVGTILYIEIDHDMAQQLLLDSLSTEQLVRAMMRGWKLVTGSEAVTVYLMSGGGQIAQGQTTLFNGDEVTLRRG